MIPIYFRYTYKNYPFSTKATTRSKQLGILTCGAMCVAYGFFWAMIVNGILMGIGIPDEISIILSLISLVGMVLLRNRIKKNMEIKIERMAMAELTALQTTDPIAYVQYAAMFAEELTRYQQSYQYQTPPQYHAPYQNQAAPHYQYQPSAQYHAPQTPPVYEPVQSAPSRVFDIQMEQPEPEVAETSAQPEAPAQQPDVIELPEILPEVSEPAPAQPEPPEEQAAPAAEPAIPEKKFCGQCGTKLKPGSLFCHNCGSKL